jgi:hypothetical protein
MCPSGSWVAGWGSSPIAATLVARHRRGQSGAGQWGSFRDPGSCRDLATAVLSLRRLICKGADPARGPLPRPDGLPRGVRIALAFITSRCSFGDSKGSAVRQGETKLSGRVPSVRTRRPIWWPSSRGLARTTVRRASPEPMVKACTDRRGVRGHRWAGPRHNDHPEHHDHQRDNRVDELFTKNRTPEFSDEGA